MPRAKTTDFTVNKTFLHKLCRSVWLFPLVATIVLFLLTALRISGSSIGIYNDFFYGPSHKDSSLILGHPQPIRSDEWIWNTQMIMAQASNHYNRINPNLGHGQDMSLIIDAPYKDWSIVFRPQNLAFFVLPFQNAFAFQWWFMVYALILGCYFFVLAILPKKKLLAVCLAIAFAASPFVQWWYQYITLAPLYYSFFVLLAFIYLLRASELHRKIYLGLGLGYALACFILVLYPPFQIPCALVMAGFFVGYLLVAARDTTRKVLLRDIGILVGAVILSCLVALLFVYTRHAAVETIENTAYPGRRLVASGGYDLAHLLSGNLQFQLQSIRYANAYQLPAQGITNQSEDSNFILFLPFLIIPSALLLYEQYRHKKSFDWVLLFLNLVFFGFLAWLFVPHLSLIGKLTQLDKVPLNRLMIGFGLVNILALVIFIRDWSKSKLRVSNKLTVAYVLLIFVIELLLGFHAKHTYPGFITTHRVIAFSLPVPVTMYCFLTKRFEWGAIGFMLFCLLMVFHINPLYQGTDIITNTPLSTTIRSIAKTDKGTWAVEDAQLENFALLNGAHSITGVYSYPQLSIWNKIPGANPLDYNRFAHVNFTFYRDDGQSPTEIDLAGGDDFGIDTEPCSSFMKINNIRFILTTVPISTSTYSCLQLYKSVPYPAITAYIYRLNW